MKRLNAAIFVTTLLALQTLSGYTQDVEEVLPKWKYITDSKVSLYNYFAGQAFSMLDDRKDKLSKLKSKQDWLKRQSQVVATFNKILGPFPQKTPLNPVVTGVVEKEGVRMEKVYFESLPGYYVTGALFLPSDKKGKVPAILWCSGHSNAGYRGGTYMPVILNLVKKGFAVFAFDPIGQGERKQYVVNSKKKLPSPTQEHSYPGSQLFLAGRSPAYYFIWDGIRAIDYLYSRQEIDTARIGVTGRSGGGTQTAYIAAFDSRVKAAAPECYITSYEKLLMTMGPQDAEQNFAKSIYYGLDIADLLVCFAPKPMLIVSTTRDIFSIQGTREVYKEVKRTYTYLGNADHLRMVEDDAGHASTQLNREALCRFFQLYLSNPGKAVDEDVPVFTEEELQVTAAGNVYASLKGDNLQTLAKGHLKQVLNKRTPITGLKDLKRRIAGVTGFTYENNAAPPIFSGRYPRKGYVVEAYLLKTPTVYLPLYWLKPQKKAGKQKTILLLEDSGKAVAIKEGGLADSLALAGYEVVVPDLSGFGELHNGSIQGGDSNVDKVPLNLWFAGILVNQSMLGIRMKELSYLIDWISQTDAKIAAIGKGVLAADLLHIAAMREHNLKAVLLIDPLLSYQTVVEAEIYKTEYMLSAVPGMLSEYDINNLISILSQRMPLFLVRPRDGAGIEVVQIEYKKYIENSGTVKLSFDAVSSNRILDWLDKL